MEYLKQQQPLVNAGASSAFWDNGTLAEWASNNHWMVSSAKTFKNRVYVNQISLNHSIALIRRQSSTWKYKNWIWTRVEN